MEQLCCKLSAIHESLYMSIFQKSAQIIQVLFKSDKNNGYFTWRPLYRVTKKRELLKNPPKIKEMQKKKKNYWQKLNHYYLPFKIWSMITNMAKLSVAQGPCSAVLPTVHDCHYAFQNFRFFCVTLYIRGCVSLNSSKCEKRFRQNMCRKSKHILCSVNFPRKFCHLWDDVENIWFGQTGHRWQCNMEHAVCLPDN